MKLLSSLRFSRPVRRSNSQGIISATEHQPRQSPVGLGLTPSPSMPVIHSESTDTAIVVIDSPVRRRHSLRRRHSQGRIQEADSSATEPQARRSPVGLTVGLTPSTSMPLMHSESTDTAIVVIDIPEPADDGSKASSIGSLETDGVYV
jgi:hypothetical protein